MEKTEEKFGGDHAGDLVADAVCKSQLKRISEKNAKQAILIIYQNKNISVSHLSQREVSLQRRNFELIVFECSGRDVPYHDLARYGDPFRYISGEPRELFEFMLALKGCRLLVFRDTPPLLLGVFAWASWIFECGRPWAGVLDHLAAKSRQLNWLKSC